MSAVEHPRGVRVLAGDAGGWDPYAPREPGGAGSLVYEGQGDGKTDLSSLSWLRERHTCSLGVPFSAGLFRTEPSEFDFPAPLATRWRVLRPTALFFTLLD